MRLSAPAFTVPIAVSLLTACAATRREAPPSLSTRAEVPVEYVARLSGEGLPRAEGLPPADAAAAGSEAVRRQVEVRCRWVALDERGREALLGPEAPRFGARLVARAQAAQALDRAIALGCADVLTAPALLLDDGRRGTLTMLEQQAYVASYEARGQGATLVADPEIGVLEEGLLLDVRATRTGGGVRLDLAVHQADLLGEPREVTVSFPGVPGSRVTIQEPLFVTQRLETQATLSPDEALVAGTLTTEDGRATLLFVTARAVDRGALSPADQPASATSE